MVELSLTKRQQEIFDFIKRYSARHGYPPTVRDIGKAIGLTSSSTVHVTGDNCGMPSDREVARTARWWARRKSAARPVSTSVAVQPGTPAQLVLVHDGAGVAVSKPVLVGQPVRALFAAQEGGAGF